MMQVEKMDLDQLDALVAERIVGWRFVDYVEYPKRKGVPPNGQLEGRPPAKARVKDILGMPVAPPSGRRGYKCIPHYSGHLVAAWEVVDLVLAILGQSPWWECRGPKGFLFTFHIPGKDISASGSTLSDAICRAALKAVGA